MEWRHDREVNNRIKTALHRWRKLARILCDQNAPVITNGMILWTVVRPAIKWRLSPENIRAALKVDRFVQKVRQSTL